MAESEVKEYKEYVSARLSELSPPLQNYALGDFSENIRIPEEEDEFTELLVGLTLMVDDIREMIEERENTITILKQTEEALEHRVQELERFNRLAVGRELRMVELKGRINELSEELGKEPPYDLSLLE